MICRNRILERWLSSVLLIAAAICCPAWAQTMSRPPDASKLGLSVPFDAKPRVGHGERYLLPTVSGQPQVVRLHCTIGDRCLVMLPTGKLDLIASIKLRPTDQPFVPATHAEMVAALKATGLGEYKIVDAKPYVFVYDCSEGFYLHTRSILETMLPGVVANLKSWGMDVVDPELLLVVVIMPSRAAFDAYEKVPGNMLAYYNVLTNYVMLYEDQKLWEAAEEYAAKQAAYTTAHEGLHQLLHNTGVQQRLSNWPMWISEGLPEYYCPLRVTSSLIKKKDSELPTRTLRWNRPGMVNDLRMYDLLRIGAKSGDVIRDLVQADSLDSDGYALAWGLVHYLATDRPKEFRAYLKELSTYEPLDPANRKLAGRPDALFVKHFGGDFAAIEQAIQQHLTSKAMLVDYVDPINNQSHYIVKRVEKKGRSFGVSLIVTTSPAAARKWKEEQEAEHKSSKFFTKICRTRQEAENEVKKLEQR